MIGCKLEQHLPFLTHNISATGGVLCHIWSSFLIGSSLRQQNQLAWGELWMQCLVLLQVSKCVVPVQIFWASPKIWLHLVHFQKSLCWHKNQFSWMQIIFLSGPKCLWLPQYVNKFLVWRKKFEPAQNILGPVKEQGISKYINHNIYSIKKICLWIDP